MHHAHRSVRIALPGTRSSATAAKIAPRPQSKWDPPQSIPGSASTTTSPSLPNLSKWGLHSSAGPSTTFSNAPRAPNKWSRPEQPAQSRATSVPKTTHSGPSKWTRPSNPPPHQGPSRLPPGSKPQYGQASTREDRQGQTRRTAPPSTTPSHSRDLMNPRTRTSVFKDILKSTPSTTVATEESKEPVQETEDRKLESSSEYDSVSADSMTLDVHRPNKGSRVAHKDRGSILARMSEDVTLPSNSRMRNAAASNKGKEKERKARRQEHQAKNLDIYIPSVISVGNLARLLNVRLDTLERKMIQQGMRDECSHDHMLTSEYSSLLAMEFNRNPIVNDEAAFDIHPPPQHPDKSTLPTRPPVVTIMGHVDHGKTTLLDTLRKTSVAKGEAGGITQHIGAFSVPVPGSSKDEQRTITFLDTPGHAAFSAMRARGAGVTDIVVLVVAADDGIMPQTREVLDLVKKEKDVNLVVAINKVDKPGVDVEKVENALLAEGIQLETFGGDIPCVHVSGLTGRGLDQLVETISVVAEMQDLRAEREGVLHGYVLESKVQKGIGPVATVLLLRGALKPSSHLICGTAHSKVKRITAPCGAPLKVVHPGTAAVVSGWKDLPQAGDEVLQGTESDVKRAINNRIRKAQMESSLNDLEAINQSRREERERKELAEKLAKSDNGASDAELAAAEESMKQKSDKKELRIVVKGDVSGSVEAVAGALQGIGNNLASVKIIATGVGDVTESDVMRAKAAEGVVVAFSVNTPRPIESLAVGSGVPILSSTIIYRLMDDVKERVIALLPVTMEKKVTGEANVLQLFDIHLKGKKTMKVAGCRITNGLVEKNKMARLVRGGETIHEGRLETLRHLKKDITEAPKGLECGISFEKFDDIREGDLIQAYSEIEKPGSL